MMFWYDHGMTGWGWFAMSLSMLVFWALIIGVGILLYRALNRPELPPLDTPQPGVRPTPEQILDERFARGEIDHDEYASRLAALRGKHQGVSP